MCCKPSQHPVWAAAKTERAGYARPRLTPPRLTLTPVGSLKFMPPGVSLIGRYKPFLKIGLF